MGKEENAIKIETSLFEFGAEKTKIDHGQGR